MNELELMSKANNGTLTCPECLIDLMKIEYMEERIYKAKCVCGYEKIYCCSSYLDACKEVIGV